jgi:acetyltransferase
VARPSARAAIEALLHPRAIAIVGATERMQYGGRLVANLLSTGYRGHIVPINPNRTTVMGLPCYPSVSDAPCLIDLAAIVIPAGGVPDVLAECGELEVPAALVISAGFAEVDSGDGLELRERVARTIELTGPRVCGPNCLGVANVADQVWASANVLAPVDERLRPGGIGVISQSGATVFGPLLALARDRGIGLRYVVSSGNEDDLTTADFVEYMVADRGVTAIACVLEGVRDGADFRRAIEIALAADKPIVVLKIGRTDVGARAARSHTAALTGRDDVFEAMVRQYGLARADDWDQLLELADVLGRGQRPRGRGIGVVSHSGGIGGLVADHCAAAGLTVPPLGAGAREAIATILAGRGAAANPADVTGHYAQETFSPILKAMLDDPAVDSLAVATAGAAAVSNRISAAAAESDKPVVACWTGGLEETEGLLALRRSAVPILYQPRDAARALAALAAWNEARDRLEEPTERSIDGDAWGRLAEVVGRQSDQPVAEGVALALLHRAGVPAVRGVGVVDPAGAARRVTSAGLRFPLVAKIDSPDLPHKSDVGGVELGIPDEASLFEALRRLDARVASARPEAHRRGFLLQETAPAGLELVLGFQHDEQLGPVVMLGLGGTRVEALRRAAWRLLPLRLADVAALIDEVGGLPALLGPYRGQPPADYAALQTALLAFARWCGDVAALVESVEVNPLIVLPEGHGVVAVDCLLLPRSHAP